MSIQSNLSWRFLKVWWRNLIVYRRTWKINFLVPLLEPAFYILAFGLGFRRLVGGISYGGLNLSYTQFIAPALIAIAVMWNSFFETTYGSFVRMYYQKTFDAMMATPLSLEEIILAEVIWAATKAAGAAAIMLVVLAPLGFIDLPAGLLVIPLAFLGGVAFGAIGMWFTGIIPSIEMFNLPVFLFITPLFLFSGTFFPVSGLPAWAQKASVLFPLYHMVEMVRLFSIGRMEAMPLLSIGYLLLFSVVFLTLAMHSMRRRLIQ
jgi:lipooligosaccharide transport system permease protein